MVEIGIIIFVISLLLGIILPIWVLEKKRSEKELATHQLEQLVEPAMEFLRDLKKISSKEENFLVGPGNLPKPIDGEKHESLLQIMSKGFEKESKIQIEGSWQGPYLYDIPSDPWRRCYLFVGLRAESDHQWILSAGPNGILETSSSDLELKGDDLGIRLR